MAYVLLLLLGAAGGAVCSYVLLESKRKTIAERARDQERRAEDLRVASADQNERQHELNNQMKRWEEQKAEFGRAAVTFIELQNENILLKRDLQNLDVHLRKLHLDREVQRENQLKIDARSKELGEKYLKDTIKWVMDSLGPNNFTAAKQRLLKAIEWCREIGLPYSSSDEEALLAELRQEYEKVVRAAFEREEQARIKAQIREEQLLLKERERELKQLERERLAIQAALDQALAEARDQHSTEVDALRARLADAEARAQRAMSQAQLTKAGNVYVISNIGSFGDGIFKIGMTRRLEPLDRIRELGDASVPFPFDVHMMISSNDAPTLENALHRAFHKLRLNKTNPRKEFFRTTIEEIRSIVEKHHGEVNYVADPEALQYRQSLSMPPEDEEFIERVFDDLEDEETAVLED